MGDAYLNRDDARMRLHETICMWDGEPVYVTFPSSDVAKGEQYVMLSHFDGSEKRDRQVRYTSRKFSYEAFPLGFMNTASAGCFFLARMPTRRQKQGLAANSIKYFPNIPRPGTYFIRAEMYNCIMGVYPSFHQAQKHMTEGTRGVAVERQLGFNKQDNDVYSLLFRTRVVGTYVPSRRKVQLLPTPSTSICMDYMDKIGLGSIL